MDGVHRAERCVLAPQQIHYLGHADRVAASGQQQRQQASLQTRACIHLDAVAPYPQRTEDLEVE
jgi:hypothetical protein